MSVLVVTQVSQSAQRTVKVTGEETLFFKVYMKVVTFRVKQMAEIYLVIMILNVLKQAFPGCRLAMMNAESVVVRN